MTVSVSNKAPRSLEAALVMLLPYGTQQHECGSSERTEGRGQTIMQEGQKHPEKVRVNSFGATQEFYLTAKADRVFSGKYSQNTQKLSNAISTCSFPSHSHMKPAFPTFILYFVE